MTESIPDMNAPLAELIDRVVDGGLTAAQLRLAVAELDRVPDGWRRCALAFLEAQCWRESLRDPGERETIPASVVSTSSTCRRRWAGLAAAAGVSLAAFSLGWLGHSLRDDAHGERDPDLPSIASPGYVGADSGAPVLAGPDPVPTPPAMRLPTVREVARLRIGTGASDSAEIPLFAGPGLDPRLLLEQPPPIPAQGRAAWERRGYQLEQRRRLVSIPLGDGRRAAVPIDQVHVRYVGQDPL